MITVLYRYDLLHTVSTFWQKIKKKVLSLKRNLCPRKFENRQPTSLRFIRFIWNNWWCLFPSFPILLPISPGLQTPREKKHHHSRGTRREGTGSSVDSPVRQQNCEIPCKVSHCLSIFLIWSERQLLQHQVQFHRYLRF